MSEPQPQGPTFLASLVSAGFPSPGDDLEGSLIDTNQLIVKNPSATFFMRVKGVSMKDAGIYEDDIVVVDKSLTARNGDTVVAVINDNYTLKRLSFDNGAAVLQAANEDFSDITPSGEEELRIWGVVTFVLRSMRPAK